MHLHFWIFFLGSLLGCATPPLNVPWYQEGLDDFQDYYTQRMKERREYRQRYLADNPQRKTPPFLWQSNLNLSDFDDHLPVLWLHPQQQLFLGLSPKRPPRRTPVCVVLIHGLTASPMSLFSLNKVFYTKKKWCTVSVLLKGHLQNPEDLAFQPMSRNIQLGDWKKDIDRGISIAQKLSDRVLLVGHSLGAGLALDALFRHENNPELVGAIAFSAPIRIKELKERGANLQRLDFLRNFYRYTEDFLQVPRPLERNNYSYRKQGLHGIYLVQQLGNQLRNRRKRLQKRILLVSSRSDPVVHSPDISRWAQLQAQDPNGWEKRQVFHSGKVLMEVYKNKNLQEIVFPLKQGLGHNAPIIRFKDFTRIQGVPNKIGPILTEEAWQLYQKEILQFATQFLSQELD